MNFKPGMQKIRYLFTAAFLPAFFFCTNFSSQFERIENDRIRLIDFIYEPPEAAPGDTVHLKAFFGGKDITPENIEWKVSFKVVVNAYGFDTAFEEVPLNYSDESCLTSEATHCIGLRFVIPENCIRQSPLIQDNWYEVLPDTLQEMLPAELRSLSKEEIVVFLDSITELLAGTDPVLRNDCIAMLPHEFANQLPLIVQLFTTKIRLFAYIKNSHRIRSDYTVSYIPVFGQFPGLNVYSNHNPIIDSVGVYKVKGPNLMDFDRHGDNTTYTTLTTKASDTSVIIEAENGYTYFLEAFVSGRDSVYTLFDIAYHQPISKEEVSADWMFQLDDDETSGLIANDLMNITPLTDLTALLYLPRKEEVKKFTIWVQVTDSRINVLNRSQGSMIAEVHGNFKYP